jgi:hypothetical protein
MNWAEQFEWLRTHCVKVGLTCNTHRVYYETVEQNLQREDEDGLKEIDPNVWREMVAKDSLVEVWAYPDTPVGFCRVYHHDVAAAVEQLYQAIAGERENQGVDHG